MHDIVLIETIAFALIAALFFALIARWLGLQPLVGYLVAGIAVGPYTPGFVGDVQLTAQLAEIGVILLMFGVGLHFHFKDLMAVRSIAVPGAIGQSLAATICGMALAGWAGWGWQAGMVLGVATSVASTVVLLRVLFEHADVDSPEGHIAIGWLLVEDIITILVLVLLPIVAVSGGNGSDLLKAGGLIVLKLGLLCAIVMFAGARLIPALLTRVARFRSQELFTLTVLVLSISVATLSYLAFGASMALGAFLAGMVVGQSPVSHQAASDALPMRDAFAVLFFVSAGMLFDYRVIFDYPWLMIGVLFIILVVKPIAAFLIVVICGHPLKTALTVAAGLAQVGEFSFILAEVGRKLELLPSHGQTVLVAAAIVSISLNASFFKHLLRLESWLLKFEPVKRWSERKAAKRIAQAGGNKDNRGDGNVRAIVVGYGIVGKTLTRVFEKFGIETLVIETNIDTVLELQAQGRAAIYGDASRRDILENAEISAASYLVVTIPSTDASMAIIQTAQMAADSIKIFVRCHYARDREHLESAGAVAVSCEELHAASAMAENVLGTMATSKWAVRKEVRRIQESLNLSIITP